MKYRWLLLDADGTLFDYDMAESVALERTFQEMELPFVPAYVQTYRRINARIWLDFEQDKIAVDRLKVKRFELLFATIGVEADAQAFSRRYLGNLADGTYLIEGAKETVQALFGRVGLMLITNGLQSVQRPRLTKSAIGGYFADMVISEEVGAAKPAPRIFEAAFEKMGHPIKEEVLIVGDSLSSDIQGGSHFGIDTCWFNPAGRPRDHEVEITYEIAHLSGLLGILDLES